jgi:hypothetical protein
MVNTDPSPARGYVLSYLGLRRAVGLIGMLLPLVLWLGTVLLGGPMLLGSISAYYYTDMGNVFVGSMCAFGVFLWSYRYGRIDNVAGNIAGTLAIGVALFPTTPAGSSASLVSVATLHLLCATLFFLTLAFFSLFLFRKSEGPMTSRKRIRNKVYTTCGWLIILALVCAVVGPLIVGEENYNEWSLLFVFETLASEAFGFAWLVKGGTILKDVSAPATEPGDTNVATAPA